MIKSYYKPLLIALSLLNTFCTRAQATEEPIVRQPTGKHQANSQVFNFVKQAPQFPGGDKALMAFLQQNIQYPIAERDKNIQGKVLVRFVVLEDGSVGEVEVIKPVSKGLDNEAVRVVKMLPKFTPGRTAGKPVKVYFNLPVEYKLTGGYDDEAVNKLAAEDKVFNMGYVAFTNRNYAQAIRCFNKSAEKNNAVVIYDLLGECYRQTHDNAAMCAAYKKALSLASKTAESNIKLYCK